MSKKVVLVTNIPTPYRIPLFNQLKNELDKKEIDFKVVFSNISYSRRKWILDTGEFQFNYTVLKSPILKIWKDKKASFLYSGLLKTIKKDNPDVVIITGFSWGTFKLWFYSYLRNIPFAIWSGTIIHQFKKEGKLRRIFRKIISKRANGFIAYGSKAREYLIGLGIPLEKISIAINTTDTDFFRKKVDSCRRKIQKSDQKILLYIGYLEKRKRVDYLLHMVKKLSEIRRDFKLLIVGDGEYKEKLEELTSALNIDEFVSFEGYKQKLEIPQYLAMADCFLFPTDYDVWGHVLEEAMISGLSCIASIQAGATYDLIRNGLNGFALDFQKIDKVVDRVNWIFDHPRESEKIGKKAREHIQSHASLSSSVRGFMKMIEDII